MKGLQVVDQGGELAEGEGVDQSRGHHAHLENLLLVHRGGLEGLAHAGEVAQLDGLVIAGSDEAGGERTVLQRELVSLETLGHLGSGIDDVRDQLLAIEEISDGAEVGALLRFVRQDGVAGDAALAGEELFSLVGIAFHREDGFDHFGGGEFSHQLAFRCLE